MRIGKSTKRALRRFQAETHMRRRLSDAYYISQYLKDWYINHSYRLKEQPKFQCHHYGCSNMREYEGPTLQEIKSDISFKEELSEHYRNNISGLCSSG